MGRLNLADVLSPVYWVVLVFRPARARFGARFVAQQARLLRLGRRLFRQVCWGLQAVSGLRVKQSAVYSVARYFAVLRSRRLVPRRVACPVVCWSVKGHGRLVAKIQGGRYWVSAAVGGVHPVGQNEVIVRPGRMDLHPASWRMYIPGS